MIPLMRALVLHENKLTLETNRPRPHVPDGWALLRVMQAGICNTDLELARGYMNFSGVLGHEFIGVVEACDEAGWIGQRVVGEINAACDDCDTCEKSLGRHCLNRTVLGILNLDGCMAEYCALPTANLRRVPEGISDDQAVFVEPLSAAFEILEQIEFSGAEHCIVLGDGKLGILCAWALSTVTPHVTLVGRHADKLERATWRSIKTATSANTAPNADVVVDATGSRDGLAQALSLCRTRGQVVLKSTVADRWDVDLTPVVINEISILGSRCGRFEHGLAGLSEHRVPVERLIDARYPLNEALAAFEHAGRKGSLKVLLSVSETVDPGQ